MADARIGRTREQKWRGIRTEVPLMAVLCFAQCRTSVALLYKFPACRYDMSAEHSQSLIICQERYETNS